MTYLVLKELTPYAKDVIIVCASLTKDMNSKNNNYRANAIRALCCAVDDVRFLFLLFFLFFFFFLMMDYFCRFIYTRRN